VTGWAAALLLAAGTPAAAPVDGAWTSQTWIEWGDPGLGDVAADLAARLETVRAAWLAGPGGGASAGTAGPRRGTGLGWEAGRRAAGPAGAGLRAAWFAAGPLTGEFEGSGALLERARIEETLAASLSLLEAGVWLAGEERGAASLRAAAFAGPAWGSLTARRVVTEDAGAPRSASASASGPGWAADLGVELGWRLLRGTTLTYASGYRWARVPVLRWAAAADLDGDGEDELVPDAVWRERGGRPLAADFSGWYFSLGVRVAL